MTRRRPDDHVENEGPWWRLDLTMVLLLALAAALLVIVGFEFWHPHFGNH